MAATISVAKATVTDDETGEVLARDEQVLVRDNVLRAGRTQLPDVMTVTQTSRGVWQVTLPGARTLTVVRSRDCGC